MEQVEKLIDVVEKIIDEAKETIVAQSAEMPKVAKGPMLEAKKELQKLSTKADMTKKQCAGVMDKVHKQCGAIINVRSAEVSGLLRAEIQKKAYTPEKLYQELVKPGEERIAEAA